MGGLSRMSRAAVQRTGYSSDDADFLPILGSVPSATGLSINQLSATSNTVFRAAIWIRSKDFARCLPRLLPAGKGRSEKPVTDHPVAKLFKRPNVIQTWFDFAVQMHTSFLLRGNGYAVILRNMRGDPLGLIPVNPDAVQLLEAPDGSIFYNVSRNGLFQMATLAGLPPIIPAEDIFHIRDTSFNMLTGISTIGIARDSLGVAMGLTQQQARFMANGARPSGVLTTPKTLSKEAADRLRIQWNSMRSGLQNVGKTAILEEGLTWAAMQLDAVNLEFVAQLKFSVEDIARWVGVPLHKLGVAGENSRIKMDDADQSYVNTTIMPDLDMWEQKFGQVFALDDEELTADFDERRLLRAAESTRVNTYRTQVISGLKTQNECRALEGDPPLKGGDVLLTPANSAANGSDVTGTPADGAGRPDEGTSPDPGF
jgi:HK97 family phage portal protein